MNIAPSAPRSWFAAVAVGTLLAVTFAPAFAQMSRFNFNRAGVPDWTVDPNFRNDVFTFARVRYSTGLFSGFRGGGDRRWQTDYPDAELNLAFRLQQMTSLKVNPEPAVVDLAISNLSEYPFLYIVEAGEMYLRDNEIEALRKYLQNGGFLMFDDFWGEYEWRNVEKEVRRVFPDREIVDLPIEHPIFHCVFELTEKPQVPGIHAARRGYENDGRDVHYRAVFDDENRMMLIICQNTDLGDGWEREGANIEYFRQYAEPKAYPMAINIIFYAMTH